MVTDGEIRLKEGSYIGEAKKLQLEFKPDPGDDKFILDGEGFMIEGREMKEEGKGRPAEKTGSGTPSGFL